MSFIEFDDGKRVELSVETTDRLRKELIADDRQLKVDRFRAVKDGSLIRIAIVECSNVVWDKDDDGGNARATHLLLFDEIEEIIEGLKRLMGDKDE